MLNRCTNPSCAEWKYYGALGITVCDRWNPAKGGSLESFLADKGPRPEGTTIGRYADLSNYEPDGCRWMTKAEQNLEKRNHNALLKWAAAREEKADLAMAA